MRFDPEKFGKRIRYLRIAQNMSQEELAEKLNTERSHIAKIETGIRSCSPDLLIAFSNLFQVSTDYLLLEVMIERDAKEELMMIVERLLAIIKKL